jgi:hypothetical protein
MSTSTSVCGDSTRSSTGLEAPPGGRNPDRPTSWAISGDSAWVWIIDQASLVRRSCMACSAYINWSVFDARSQRSLPELLPWEAAVQPVLWKRTRRLPHVLRSRVHHQLPRREGELLFLLRIWQELLPLLQRFWTDDMHCLQRPRVHHAIRGCTTVLRRFFASATAGLEAACRGCRAGSAYPQPQPTSAAADSASFSSIGNARVAKRVTRTNVNRGRWRA